MRKLVVCLAAVVLLTGCPKKKGDAGDAAAEEDAAATAETPSPATTEEDAAAAAPALPTAKNEGDVARFKGETALGDDDDTIAIATVARTAPKSGTAVATLKPGTDVGKIASHQDSILISFLDPKDSSTTLMGWVGKEAFVAPAAAPVVPKTDAGATPVAAADAGAPAPKDAGPPAFTCPAGQEAINLAAGPTCKKKCSKDADCKTTTPGACAIGAALHGGRAVRVCIND